MTVEIIEDKVIWDQFVDSSAYAALSHKWDFLKIAEKYSGHSLRTYGFYKGEELRNLPLVIQRVKGLRTIYSPPPTRGMLNLGFLVSKEYDSLKQSKKESFLSSFLGEIEIEMQKYSPDYTLIYTVPNFPDIRFFKWNNYTVVPRYTYTIDLNQKVDDLWNNLHKDVKRCVKLAEGNGLELRKSDDVSALYERQETRYKEKAANYSMDADYLKEVLKAYPDNIKIYYVHNDKGEIVSGMISQEYNGRFIVWIGIARSEEHANEFLIWKLMAQAKSEGFKKFEIAGGDDINQCKFKSRFSPSLETWYHVSKKSMLGEFAGWTYANLYKRTRLKGN